MKYSLYLCNLETTIKIFKAKLKNVMKKRRLLLVFALMTTLFANAQWRVGVTAGADYNVFSIDKQYMTDVLFDGRWGVTCGVTGQYNFTDWFGVRADFNMTQKNYRMHRAIFEGIDLKYRNTYLQLPVMASFSFGGETLRGFCNLGVYGGYWARSYRYGQDINSFTGRYYDVKEKVAFNSDRDKRWDCGLVGGVGLEYQFAEHWAAQVEVRYYYSTTSTTKQYMKNKDYRYNSTTAIQIGASYIF